MGQYRCFLVGDWQRGLPRLAAGSDAKLKALAEAELAKPTTGESYVNLGDGWWDAASQAPAAHQANMQHRSAHWYRQALPSLKGFSKVRIENRLRELPEAPPPAVVIAGSRPESILLQEDYAANLRANGGTTQTTQAIDRALSWLAKNQDSRTGGWSLKGPYSDGGQYDNPPAATGMAMLAMVWAGNTQQAGRYKANMGKGLKFLVQMQEPDGGMGNEGPSRQRLYTQGICTLALSEIYRRTKDEHLQQVAQKAVDYCVASQHRMGGWRYSPKSDSDTSVTGWVVSALHAAQQGELNVPERCLHDVGEYLTKASQSNGSRYGYQAGSSGTPVLTAAGLLCRQHTGWEANDPRMLAGADWLISEHMPTWEGEKKRNIYYWYYGMRMMHNVGGARWQRWSQHLHELLIRNQAKTGRERGSWHPVGPQPDIWGYEAGRLYTTCLSTYVFETFYLPPPKVE